MYIVVMLAVAYLVRILLFDGSAGPFEDENALIVDDGEILGHPDFFDFIRGIFGAYQKIKKDDTTFWHVKQSRMAVWRCPKCLGFWVSFILNIFYFSFGFLHFILFPLYVFSMAFCAAFLVFAMRALEERG